MAGRRRREEGPLDHRRLEAPEVVPARLHLEFVEELYSVNEMPYARALQGLLVFVFAHFHLEVRCSSGEGDCATGSVSSFRTTRCW